eukprot:COSAG04_NODE_1388_length_6961_cov_6.032498_2_plen_112_part_00
MAHKSADVISELLLQPELLLEREAVGVGGAGLLARGAAPRRQLDQPALCCEDQAAAAAAMSDHQTVCTVQTRRDACLDSLTESGWHPNEKGFNNKDKLPRNDMGFRLCLRP